MVPPTRNLELATAITRAAGSRATAQVAGITDHDRLVLACGYDELLVAGARDADAAKVIIEVFHRGAWREFGGFGWRGGVSARDLISVMGSATPGISIPIPQEYRGLDFRFHLDVLKGIRTGLVLTTLAAGEKFLAGTGPQSVAYDSVGSTDFANVSSASYTHTFSGTPTGVAVMVCTGQYPAGTSTVSGVTVNGVSADNEGTVTRDSASAVRVRSTAFTLASPGTGTVATTFAAGGHYGGVGSVGVVGGDTGDVADGFASGSGTNSNPSISVTSTTGDLIIDGVAGWDNPAGTLAVGAGQTERVNRKNSGSNSRIGVSTEPGPTATMSWTFSGTSSRTWTQVGVNMRQAGGGSAYDEDVSLARNVGVATSTSLAVQGSLVLAVDKELAEAASIVMLGAVTLESSQSVASAGGKVTTDALSLGVELSITMVGSPLFSDAVALAKTANLSVSTLLTREGLLSLGRELAASLDARGDFGVSLTTSLLLGIQAAATATMGAGVSLGSLRGLTVASGLLGGVTTPRLIAVRMQCRVEHVNEEDRVIEVRFEKRTEAVDP